MAIEAHHHLHPFPSQLLSNNSDVVHATEIQQLLPGLMYDVQRGFVAPVSAPASATGLILAPAASRKRTRRSSFLGNEMSFHLRQQMFDIDCLVQKHAEKLRAELAERRRRFTLRMHAAMEERASENLKAKGEELARVGKLNQALEDRIKSLCVERQMWRDLALGNEAVANELRTNLEQALLTAQARDGRKTVPPAPENASDAESCCCGDNTGEGEGEKEEASGGEWRRVCRRCSERVPSVLLLPCRHLCLCTLCGPAVAACPICNCAKNGSVRVNMF